MALEAQAREAAAKAPDAEKLAVTAEKGQQLLRDIAEIEAQTIAAEERVLDLAAEVKIRQEASEAARFRAGQLTTEVETLFKLLKPAREDGLPPIVDQLRVQPGYEMALGAALGDDLDAPVGEEAPMHWRRIDMGARRPGAAARRAAAGRHGRGAAGADAAAEADRHRRACRRQAAAIGAEAGTAAGIARGRPVAVGRVRRRRARADGRGAAAGRAQPPGRNRRAAGGRARRGRGSGVGRSARRPSCIAWRRPRSGGCASSGATRNRNWRACARR